jgi:hypothetical protein
MAACIFCNQELLKSVNSNSRKGICTLAIGKMMFSRDDSADCDAPARGWRTETAADWAVMCRPHAGHRTVALSSRVTNRIWMLIGVSLRCRMGVRGLFREGSGSHAVGADAKMQVTEQPASRNAQGASGRIGDAHDAGQSEQLTFSSTCH